MRRTSLWKHKRKPRGWITGQFKNARGGMLHFGKLARHKEPLAHIVYVEGLGEYTEKKYGLADDFNHMACNFSVIDRHGQGRSTRYFPHDDPHKQHSEGVGHDIDDLVQYCRTHIPANEPVILLGNSTGGLIALLALENHADLFKGAILVSPLFGIKDSRMSKLEYILAKIPLPEKIQQEYVPGGGRWKPRSHPESSLSPEDFSSDPVLNKINDYWPKRHKILRSGDTTIGWIQNMCRAIIKARDPDTLKNIKQPVLIFTGEHDVLVQNKYTPEIVSALSNAEHIHYHDGKHELLMDKHRKDILKQSRTFLKNSL